MCWDRFLIQSKPERLKDSRQSKKEKDVLVIDVDPKKTWPRWCSCLNFWGVLKYTHSLSQLNSFYFLNWNNTSEFISLQYYLSWFGWSSLSSLSFFFIFSALNFYYVFQLILAYTHSPCVDCPDTIHHYSPIRSFLECRMFVCLETRWEWRNHVWDVEAKTIRFWK